MSENHNDGSDQIELKESYVPIHKSFTPKPGVNKPANWPPAPGELFIQQPQTQPPANPSQNQGQGQEQENGNSK